MWDNSQFELRQATSKGLQYDETIIICAFAMLMVTGYFLSSSCSEGETSQREMEDSQACASLDEDSPNLPCHDGY